MFAKGILFSVLVIILAIVAFAALIGVIAKWKIKKIRNLCVGVFFGCSLLAASAGGYLLYKTITVGGKALKEEVETSELLNNLLSSSPLIDTLRLYEPEGVDVPGLFYSYGGYRDYYRMPLVYPYSLICIDDTDIAYIDDELKVSNILTDAKKAQQVMSGIEYFTFDRNMLLAKTKDASLREVYVLLVHEPKQLCEFDTEAELKQYAAQHGFDTARQMKSVYDYYYNSRDFLK